MMAHIHSSINKNNNKNLVQRREHTLAVAKELEAEQPATCLKQRTQHMCTDSRAQLCQATHRVIGGVKIGFFNLHSKTFLFSQSSISRCAVTAGLAPSAANNVTV